MAEDQTNPFTVAGMAAMMQPNKYTDPALQGKPLQLQGYRGTPTDAMGRPIQSFLDAQAKHDAWDTANPQGTTLNSPPSAQGGGGGSIYDNPKYIAQGGMGLNMGQAYPLSQFGAGQGNQNQQDASGLAAMMGLDPSKLNGMGGGGQQQQQQAAPAGQNPVDMRQAYLDALSNPGKVTTPGATVPQAQPLGSPSVMSAFLAAHPGGGGGPAAGNYTNKPFFDTLNQLRSA